MRRLVAIALVAAAFGGILAGCGDTGDVNDDPVYGVGQVRAGSVAALAQCEDWNEGTEEERLATIDDIHAQLNQAGADGPTANLPVDEAYDLFERACTPTYAAGFRLYKLYARDSAFSEIPEQ